ncbi:phage tail protein [Oscillatoria acuminata]|uniref:T4-like virus tail tube protein gp19 n=1 Tax=Oscillatoria acuminata PCC 6304 TaxID=56110 RepID=K9TF87_9CYAN|nr:phage tail protein [Oscillatoria acuminata]AFY80771.1 T4-like virus tail tube protein gp19 [Oscillatoria acuminata PCC 6304]
MADLFVISSNRFSFTYGGKEFPLLKISGIDVQAKTAGHKSPIASGKNAQMSRQTVSTGYYNNQNITIEAVLQDGVKTLYDIFKKGLPATYGGDGKWSGNFSDAAITIFDPDAKEVLTYNLKQCQMVSYEVSEFNVSGDQFLTEKFELNVESVERKQ